MFIFFCLTSKPFLFLNIVVFSYYFCGPDGGRSYQFTEEKHLTHLNLY